MIPGVHYTYQNPVHVNSLGLRGPELPPKEPNEVRVFALGDSLVYGQGVGDAETIPAYLEEALETIDPLKRRWTVVNGGHRAFDTPQEIALLRDLRAAVQPDVVILFWYWNDLVERDVQRTYEGLRLRGPVAFDTAEKVEGWSYRKWQALQLVRRSALVMALHDAVVSRGDGFHEPAFVDYGMKRLSGYLDVLRALGEETGFDLVVATVPDANAIRGAHRSSPVADRVVALARQRAIPAARLLGTLREVFGGDERLPVIPYDGHYLPKANRVMAQEVAALIAARHLPRPRRTASRTLGPGD
jgi:hypothetical protein